MSQLEVNEVETVELSDSEPEPKKSGNPEVLCVDSDDDDCIVVANSNVTQVESEPAKRDRLVKEFILITKTDSKAASFFLEQHDWKLDVAVNDFLNLTGQILSENSSMAQSVQNEKWAKDAKSGAEVKGAFSFISWNVDGLDKRNLSPRTANLIKVLNQEAADIVFLQEVVPETINHLKSNLSIYDFTVQQYEKNMSEAYFVCTLTKRGAVKVVNKTELPFANSVMMRALLMVEVEIGGVKMWLMNTHLESTAQYKEARVSQLKFAFKQLTDKQRTHSVLFAGDLNLRDPEVPMAGGIPSCAFDLWEACDRRDVCKFTWDASRNTNIQFGNFGAREGNSSGRQFKPRLRFDRAYLAPCGRDGADRPVAKHFGLVGISKVPGMQCYTSDHWGLQVYFTVNKP